MSLDHYMFWRRVINNAIDRGKELRKEEDAKRERQLKAEADQEANAESQEECNCGCADNTLTCLDNIPF